MREGGKEGKENKNILFLTSLAFQWLGLWALTAEGMGSIPDEGSKIPASHKARPK